MCDVYQLPSPALYLLHPHSLKTHYQVFTQHNTLYLLQPDQNFLMKVKVEDLEGLLTQKHGVIVMKVKLEDLGGSLNIQEYLLLLC